MSKKLLRRNSRGSALFTVICVMSIMLVVAITAMAMISISYTKSLQNYTSSQSYVTAKNTLDMIVEVSDNKSTTVDYGQTTLSDTQLRNVSKPIYDLLVQTGTDYINSNPIGDGSQVKYGTLGTLPDTFGGCQYVTLGSGPNSGQIKYEVLPDPGIPITFDLDGDGNNETTINYGEWKKLNTWDSVTGNGYDEEIVYGGARIKMTVRVSSGVGDSAQTRTVSRIFDAKIISRDRQSPAAPPITVTIPDSSGKFTQAIQTLGQYTSGTGMMVLGGISAKGGGGDFNGLKNNTSSVYINGDFDPEDSGHSGIIDVNGGQSITVNGELYVHNQFNFKSLYDPSTNPNSRPFIYCDTIKWSNSDIPTGEIDVIAAHGGIYGRDNNIISGKVSSGGDLTLKGNNLVVNGDVFIDGNLSFDTCSIDNNSSGTIYISGSYDASKFQNSNVTIVEKESGFLNLSTSNVDPNTGAATVSIPSTPVTSYQVSTDKSVFGKFYDEDNNLITASSLSGVTIDENVAPGIDTTTSPIYIDVAEGSTQSVYLPSGDYSGVEIIVRGGGDVNIYQNGDVSLAGAKVWSELVKDKVENNSTIDMSTLADEDGYSLITWYVEGDSKLTLSASGGGDNLLNAYIYGPEANIETIGGSASGPTLSVKDDNGNISNVKTAVLGSVIGKNVSICDGSSGIVYINPNGTNGGSGNGKIIVIDPGHAAGGFQFFNAEYDLQSGAQLYTNRV